MAILIADDDPVTRALLIKTLNKWGYDVLVANDGLEALEIVEKDEVRIVITDWMMPNMDGLTLCKEIRSLSNSNYVYILTGRLKRVLMIILSSLWNLKD